MAAKERLARIEGIICKEKKVSVTALSDACSVTEETIRKDLTKLEKEGLLTRVHGGAILNASPLPVEGVDFVQRKGVNIEEKRLIAEHVQKLLKGKDTVFADASSTVAESLRQLPREASFTVVSNSAEIFMELAHTDIHVISTGGDFNKSHLSLQGLLTKAAITKYNVDIALISCKALDLERGVQDSNEAEAEIKKLMITQAREVALLADHSKFDKTAFVRLLDLAEVHYLITDRAPGLPWENYCREHQITLLY